MEALKTKLYDLLSVEEAIALKKAEVRNCILADVTIEDLVTITKTQSIAINHHDLPIRGVMEVTAELLDRNRKKNGTFV